jgi:hypothetical protein
MMSKAIWAGAAHRLIATIAAGGIATAALLLAALPAGAQTPDKARHMIDGVRDARYC